MHQHSGEIVQCFDGETILSNLLSLTLVIFLPTILKTYRRS